MRVKQNVNNDVSVPYRLQNSRAMGYTAALALNSKIFIASYFLLTGETLRPYYILQYFFAETSKLI